MTTGDRITLALRWAYPNAWAFSRPAQLDPDPSRYTARVTLPPRPGYLESNYDVDVPVFLAPQQPAQGPHRDAGGSLIA